MDIALISNYKFKLSKPYRVRIPSSIEVLSNFEALKDES